MRAGGLTALTVTAPNAVGRSITYRFRDGGAAALSVRCLAPA
jgi:hypothetical protein